MALSCFAHLILCSRSISTNYKLNRIPLEIHHATSKHRLSSIEELQLKSSGTHPEFLGDLVVVGGDGGKLLFQLALGGGKIDVDGGEFGDAGAGVLVHLLDGPLAAHGLQKIATKTRTS